MHGIVVGGSLNRRQTASKSAKSLGSYSDGAYIDIDNYNNEWYKTTFDYNGSTTTGYVMKAYVVRQNDTVQVRKNSVNVRKEPNANSAVLYTVNSGVSARVSSIENSNGYGWIQGNFGQSTGWIRGDMFKKKTSGGNESGGTEVSGYDLGMEFQGNVVGDRVALRYGPGTDYGKRNELDQLAFIDIRLITAGGTAEQRESWAWCNQTLNNAGSGFVYARYIKATNDSGIATSRITANSVNIRVRPSTSSEAFGRLNTDDKVHILDTTHNGWWRVSSSLGIGWVSSQFIE